MARVFITGITGQDGSYLAEALLRQGDEVHGLVRRSSGRLPSPLASLVNATDPAARRLTLHYADLQDTTTLRRILLRVAPEELYHLAGQSHVGLSFEIPEATCELVAMGTLRLLEIVRDLPRPPRFFHASSSEIFGRPSQPPQDEETPYAPVNPYGCAKAFATRMVALYRRTHGLFACNGILFNHESPRRGEQFVTRKICRAAARIKRGRQAELSLGNLSAQRDWGHARDYVRGMWLALRHEVAEDYVFATGQLHSVQDVVERAFAAVALDWRRYVQIDPALLRRAEPVHLLGNPAKAKRLLDWAPQTTFAELITEMTEAELAAADAVG